MRTPFILLLGLSLALGTPCRAANHYVRPGAKGASNGADWTNAFTSIPTGVSMKRGDIYYLAGGNYGPYTFSTAESGTSPITIKAATIADHGTSTGWSNSYAVDGGAGQAVFANPGGVAVFTVDKGYLSLDGNGTSSTAGCQSSICGIKIDNAGCVSTCWALYADTTGLSSLTLRYVEIQGIGNQGSVGPFEEDVRFVGTSYPNGCKSCTLQHNYLHSSSSTFIQVQGTDSLLLEYNVFDNNYGNVSANHGAAYAGSNDSNVTIRYNEFIDNEGTAVIEEGVNPCSCT